MGICSESSCQRFLLLLLNTASVQVSYNFLLGFKAFYISLVCLSLTTSNLRKYDLPYISKCSVRDVDLAANSLYICFQFSIIPFSLAAIISFSYTDWYTHFRPAPEEWIIIIILNLPVSTTFLVLLYMTYLIWFRRDIEHSIFAQVLLQRS